MPSTSAVDHIAAEPELQADASSVDIDGVDVDAAHSGILGGELYTPLPSYSVFINRPLGADLSDALKAKIRGGEYVNIQLLLSSDNAYDEVHEQQHLTLEVIPNGNLDSTLSLIKPSRS